MNLILDRISSVPLYAQIHGEIRRQIETDQLKAGAAVPSERELAEVCKVSRMTARQALNALKSEGYVYQERGIGTFVSKRKLDIHTRNLIGFTEEMRGRGFMPSTKILLSRRENAPQEVAQQLGIDAEDEVFISSACGSPTICRSLSRTRICPSNVFPIWTKKIWKRNRFIKFWKMITAS